MGSNSERLGQKLINAILQNYPDMPKTIYVIGNIEEAIQSYLNLRARFIESIIYNMSDKEFQKKIGLTK